MKQEEAGLADLSPSNHPHIDNEMNRDIRDRQYQEFHGLDIVSRQRAAKTGLEIEGLFHLKNCPPVCAVITGPLK